MYILQSYYMEPYEASDINIIAVSESVEALKALAVESDEVFDQQWVSYLANTGESWELTTSETNEYYDSGFIITPVKMV